ncbi:sulfatase-like hydrolase/transferase [Cerasicoccus maritimus]|uniref:sulfatase-like hydrolase/transferase n=1 Tax=Cerasicoccus maritimus TaxID=490089 RepID=UPI002852D4A1|nr:sulfatase-like hydrolase/transferase [Cerasicoccus maritimus]
MKKPNFIIIYADDLGFGDLSCYGALGIPTPNLDSMAAEGIKFSQCYATAATCTPSRYSLLTGSYPWRNPRAQILAGDAPMIIGEREATLPGLLKDAGYATGVIGKWHIGLGDGDIDWNGQINPSPLDVGFDESFIMAATNDRVPCVYVDGNQVANLDPDDPIEVVYGKENPFSDVPTGRSHPERLTMKHSDEQHWDTIVNGVPRIGFCRGGGSAQWDDETMAEEFLDRSKSFISKHKEEPFFLYYALHQPHVPRIPSLRFAGATNRGPRGDVIVELDWCVGQILEHLKAEGIDENTVVIFSSDNGPVLKDGYEDHCMEMCGCHKPTGPLRGGKYSMFEGGCRVPTILHAPGMISPGESAALISHVDFIRSFAIMAGIEALGMNWVDSQDMSQALLGVDPVGREFLITEGIWSKTVIRYGKWVFIPPYDGPPVMRDKFIETGNSTVSQLYDLETDIGQRHNVCDHFPDVVKELTALLRSEYRDSPPPTLSKLFPD